MPRIHNGKKIVSSINGVGKNWITKYRRMKLDPYFTPDTKFNSKWTKHLNVTPETVKLLEEIIGEIFLDIVCAVLFMV